MRIKTAFKRICINILLILAAFVFQTCLFPYFGFFSAVPNLLLIITFTMGFIYGSATGMYCGLVSGLLMDLFYSVPFGMNMLIFSYLGYLNGYLTKYYYDDYLTLPMVLCLLNELAYNAIMLSYRFLISGSVDLAYTFRAIILPEAFFSLIVTIILYRVLLLFNQKLDSIDRRRGQFVA